MRVCIYFLSFQIPMFYLLGSSRRNFGQSVCGRVLTLLARVERAMNNPWNLSAISTSNLRQIPLAHDVRNLIILKLLQERGIFNIEGSGQQKAVSLLNAVPVQLQNCLSSPIVQQAPPVASQTVAPVCLQVTF